MTALEFTIPLGNELPTPNLVRTKHWSWRARVTKDLRGAAWMATREALIDWMASQGSMEARDALLAERVLRRVEFTLVRGKGQQMLDPDAVPSALKPILDGIVDTHLLVDDSAKWCQPVYAQERGDKPLLRVEIRQ